jgi:flagellar hook-length control protein FliK
MPIMQVNGNIESLNSSQKTATKDTAKKGGFADILDSSIQNVSQDSQQVKSNGDGNVQLDGKKIDLKGLQKLLMSLEQLLNKSKDKEVPGVGMNQNQLMMVLQQLYQLIQLSSSELTGTMSNQATGSASVLQLLGTTPQQSVNVLTQGLAKILTGLQSKGTDGLSTGLNTEIAQTVRGLSDLVQGITADTGGDAQLNTEIAQTVKGLSDLVNGKPSEAAGAVVDQGTQQTDSNKAASTSPLKPNQPSFTSQKALKESAGQNDAISTVTQTKQAVVDQTAPTGGSPSKPVKESNPSNVSSNEGLSVKGSQASETNDTQKVAYQQLQNPPLADISNGTQLKKANLPLVPSRFFVKEMEVVISNQVRLNNGTGAYETTLRLFPENLGQVDVKISALNGQITAQFLTSSAAGKEMVERQLDQLKNTLVNQGLEVSKLEVVQNTTTPSDSSNNESNGNLGDQQKNHSQSQQQESNNKEEQPARNFFEDLRSAASEDNLPDDFTDLDGVDLTA